MNQTGTFKMTEIQPITPYLCCKNAAKAVEFYVNAFGAEETDIRVETPDRQIGHVELAIGNGRIMLSDEFPEMGALSPETLGGRRDNWRDRRIAFWPLGNTDKDSSGHTRFSRM